ncbi:VOC family protein [Actinoplanes couchii]|uniref:VOC domain-containing protein n=1 Tax=Actinoplanes couchii TaxID=403638 RepID=A0ABQ3XRZ3_9ACTN|nr:VOC family protein [Actinoplanes couchii]MDR6318745.1 catechol 2,3-dioxygenase [Actinoplanes couchii]GID61273.1 hypothetical protein Aco03nite_096770 [Actinoplanes couchii]
MHRALALGAVEVSVADLGRSITYYTDVIGLRVLHSGPDAAHLGVPGRTLVVLRSRPGAAPAPREATGLSHFAPQVPDRADLDRFVTHYLELGLKYQLADHSLAHSIYVTDPDGHGIEITTPRPREQWEWAGDQPAIVARPMLPADFTTGEPFTGLPRDTTMGHVQLKVSDAGLADTERFYCDLIGTTVQGRLGDIFLAVGVTEHRALLVLTNRFSPVGGGGAAEDDARLLGVELHCPDVAALQARLTAAGYPHLADAQGLLVNDPSGNTLRFRPPPVS